MQKGGYSLGIDSKGAATTARFITTFIGGETNGLEFIGDKGTDMVQVRTLDEEGKAKTVMYIYKKDLYTAVKEVCKE